MELIYTYYLNSFSIVAVFLRQKYSVPTLRHVLLTILLLSMTGCSVSPDPKCLLPNEHSAPKVFLIDHGYHSGIAVAASDITVESLPELIDFPGSQYLEIGWGDREYYMHPDPGLVTAFSALFFESPGVLHVAGFTQHPTDFFSTADVQTLSFPKEKFHELMQYVSASFERPSQGMSQRLGPGLYGKSAFYPSTHNFSLFNTCHTWVQGALNVGGC